MEAMLFSQMAPLPGYESRFQHWYDTEHVPLRMALPGFLAARRYRAIKGQPEYLAIYDVADVAVFESPGFIELRSNPSTLTREMLGNVTGLTRFICEKILDIGPDTRGDCLSVVALNVLEPGFATLHDRLRRELSSEVNNQSKRLRIICYRIAPGGDRDWTHIVLYEMSGSDAKKSPAPADPAASASWDAVLKEPWVTKSERWLYRLIAQATATDGH